MKNKDVLIIGFQKRDSYMYPHLKIFIDSLSSHCKIDYFFFRERGLFFEGVFIYPFNIGSYLALIKGILFTFIDILRLFFDNNKYDAIISIDIYIYVIATIIKKNSNHILWSHDIIGMDHNIYNTKPMKLIRFCCSNNIKKFNKIIIQDPNRLKVLLETLSLSNYSNNTYFLPVFLNTIQGRCVNVYYLPDRPRVLQCGGIGYYRFSDKILIDYQKNFNKYQLIFHGFFHQDIKTTLMETKIKPLISSTILEAHELHQIIDFCDIGFIGYRSSDMNHRYISKASGQFVEFLRMGKPVIVMSNSDLNEYVESYGVGISITSIDEISLAIEKIKKNYSLYSSKCLECYNSNYCESLYIPNILAWIISGLSKNPVI